MGLVSELAKDFDGFFPNPPALSSFSHQNMLIAGGPILRHAQIRWDLCGVPPGNMHD